MIIECPHCLTRFRLDPAQLSDSRSMLKCARCRRVFPAPGRSSSAHPRTKSPSPQQNLSFSFEDDDDEWRAPELTPEHVSEEEFPLNASDVEAEPPPPQLGGARTAGDSEPTIVAPGRRATTPERRAAPRRPVQEELDLVRDDDRFDIDDDDEAAPLARQGGGISVRSVFVFLALIVCGYGALTWTLLDDPDWAGRLTQTVPLIGKEVRDRTVGQDVALIEVNGRYERTKEGKLVFVVTGKAVNHSAESLAGVQIVSRLYDPTQRPVGEQITACGNPMETRISDLSIHQAAILRGIKPPPEFAVQPGGQCPFVAIFLDVPTTVETFSTEVVRARRQV
jgi:predicted Zn finger-like uncharacterized protein